MGRPSKYETSLRRRIQDVWQWPDVLNLQFLGRLEKFANTALSKRTIEGNVSSMLIYHQLVEEFVQALLADAEFFIQLSVFPRVVSFELRDKWTFGRRLGALRLSMEFGGKKRFLKDAGALNNLRNDLAHRLTKRGSLGLSRDAKRAKRLYWRCWLTFAKAHGEFYEAFRTIGNGQFRTSIAHGDLPW